MCGINGFSFKNDDCLKRMNEVTKHRGPDQTALFSDAHISLGFNRLSIIDLSERGNQPMWDEREELVIVFNGEIYNFKELRSVLEKKYAFRSQSDTEVILYAYREWGIECIKKLNGMFALAIWDTRTSELFLARDPMGVKPLYYYFDGERLIFSSEIKAVLEHNIPRSVDVDAFNFYCRILYVPEPLTMFEDIKKLPAAHYAHFKNNKLTITRYWQIDNFTDFTSYNNTREQVRNLFDDSVRRQLVSDRPVGVFLSGGIDSTAVLGAVKKYTTGLVSTFSVGFATKKVDENKFNADFLLARKSAQFFNSNHHELVISARDIGDNLEKIVWHLDEPNFNATAGAVYLLSQEAKKKVTVVLGGDGGDELFGGYPRYYYSRLLSYYWRLPRAARTLIETALQRIQQGDLATKIHMGSKESRILRFLSQKNDTVADIMNPSQLRPNVVNGYFAHRFFSNSEQQDDFEKKFMNIDRQSWLVDESLTRTDRMTMAFGIEERVPILDIPLATLAYRIPTKWKFSVWQKGSTFQGKKIWIDAVKDYLPAHVLHQEKRGWFTPMAKWIREDLLDQVADIISPHNIQKEFFNPQAVQRIWRDHLSGKKYNLNIIWAIVMWQLWYNAFIKKYESR